MPNISFSLKDAAAPEILAREKDFLLIYKPPRMHSSRLAKSTGVNVVDYFANEHPEIASAQWGRAGEGGLIHRLDYETNGLMIIARNKKGADSLLFQQEQGKIAKYYSALSFNNSNSNSENLRLRDFPFQIKSAFRPYGKGRKTVRPVAFPLLQKRKGKRKTEIALDRGSPYITEIMAAENRFSGFVSFNIKLLRGFRHQIRSHLAWAGFPILNDKLYGGIDYENGLLALRAFSLSFRDPSSGNELSFSLPVLDLT